MRPTDTTVQQQHLTLWLCIYIELILYMGWSIHFYYLKHAAPVSPQRATELVGIWKVITYENGNTSHLSITFIWDSLKRHSLFRPADSLERSDCNTPWRMHASNIAQHGLVMAYKSNVNILVHYKGAMWGCLRYISVAILNVNYMHMLRTYIMHCVVYFCIKIVKFYVKIGKFFLRNRKIFTGKSDDYCRKIWVFTGTFDDLNFPVKTVEFSCKNCQIFF